MRVTVHGAPVRTWADVRRAAGFTGDEQLVSSWLSQSELSPAQVFTIIHPDDNAASLAKFKQLLPGEQHAVAMTVCYCSVLDDCWVAGDVARNDGESEPSDSCPITAAERFTQ
jgi:hypothetical protein